MSLFMLMAKNGDVIGIIMTNKLGSSNPNRIKKYKVKKNNDSHDKNIGQSIKIIFRSLAVIAFFIYLSYLIYSDLLIYFSTKS